MSDLVKDIKKRIEQVDQNDELFEEVDLEIYDEEICRL